MDGPESGITAAHRDAIRALLAGLLNWADGFSGERAWREQPGSAASADRRVDFDIEPLADTTLGAASAKLASGFDHCRALLALLGDSLFLDAPWTCMRSTLETSAYVMWLTEVPLATKQRIARIQCLRMQELNQQLSFLGAAPSGVEKAPLRHRIAERKTSVIAQAARHGVKHHVGKRGRSLGFDEEREWSSTELIGRFLDLEPAWRASSAVAHGTVWSSYGRSAETDPATLLPGMSPSDAVLAVLSPSVALTEALGALFRYCGWDRTELESRRAQILEIIQPQSR